MTVWQATGSLSNSSAKGFFSGTRRRPFAIDDWLEGEKMAEEKTGLAELKNTAIGFDRAQMRDVHIVRNDEDYLSKRHMGIWNVDRNELACLAPRSYKGNSGGVVAGNSFWQDFYYWRFTAVMQRTAIEVVRAEGEKKCVNHQRIHGYM